MTAEQPNHDITQRPLVPDPTAAQGRGRRRRRPPEPPGARRRRRPRSRTNLLLIATAAVVVLAVAAGGAVYLRLSGNINTFDGKGLSHHRPRETPGDAQNILLIGSDSRSGDNARLGGGEDPVGRSDTTILLHVYADRSHAVGVSIPRDSLVDTPPCLLPDSLWSPPRTNVMFNSAFTLGSTPSGNPACTQNTVEALTGLRIDHTVVVNFAGFAAMTEAVGGVPVCLPKDIYQKDLNPNRPTQGSLVYREGEQKVSGKAALDYVRLRHGIGDGSDIGRTKRQQAFVSSLIGQVKREGFGPSTLLPLANAATKSLTVDPGLDSAAKLMSFAMSLKDIDLGNIQFLTVPWEYSGARVALVHPDADNLWATLKEDRTLDGRTTGQHAEQKKTTPAPTARTTGGAGITVAVYNGTTTSGLAARAAGFLRAERFTVSGTATANTQNHTTTVVQYGAGLKTQARTLATLFPEAQLQPIPGHQINLIAGQDYANAPTASPASAPAATSELPSAVTAQARPADRDICSDLSYG
ncbi:LCP family protein [Streptomyces sp. NBC_01433]|uniref:LCP family protein n=1 Tax=Streptomyces sp. NBC_01433 TaxID=2903864 RepID=UPI0022595A0C|nr:LCP family protein [Streptomyces sp. NBC_01433]MCX4681162.1 LCP family protein [Streptomyces sp. NBC_01433]